MDDCGCCANIHSLYFQTTPECIHRHISYAPHPHALTQKTHQTGTCMRTEDALA